MHSCTASMAKLISSTVASSFRGVKHRLDFFKLTRFLTVVVWCKFVCFAAVGADNPVADAWPVCPGCTKAGANCDGTDALPEVART